MRPLFLSERRLISSIIEQATGELVTTNRSVISDWYDDNTTFNGDFWLEFVDRSSMNNYTTFCQPILPDTLGAEVFVTVDKTSLEPLVVTQMEGMAFPVSYFAPYIARVEQLLDRALALQSAREFIRFESAAFSRLIVFGRVMSFLVFPRWRKPGYCDDHKELYASREAVVEYGIHEGQIEYVDGWIKTVSERSDLKLWATRH